MLGLKNLEETWTHQNNLQVVPQFSRGFSPELAESTYKRLGLIYSFVRTIRTNRPFHPAGMIANDELAGLVKKCRDISVWFGRRFGEPARPAWTVLARRHVNTKLI